MGSNSTCFGWASKVKKTARWHHLNTMCFRACVKRCAKVYSPEMTFCPKSIEQWLLLSAPPPPPTHTHTQPSDRWKIWNYKKKWNGTGIILPAIFQITFFNDWLIQDVHPVVSVLHSLKGSITRKHYVLNKRYSNYTNSDDFRTINFCLVMKIKSRFHWGHWPNQSINK